MGVGTLNQLFVRYCQSENEFSKKKTCQGVKLCFFALDPSVPSILFVITLVFDRAASYGNVAFSIIALSTEKQCPSFFKSGFHFSENVF